jgi:hypothetical protein
MINVYQTLQAEDKLKNLTSSLKKKSRLETLFPGEDLAKLQRICQEKDISLETLLQKKKQNPQADLIALVTMILADRQNIKYSPGNTPDELINNTKSSGFYSPYEVYAKNYLNIISESREDELTPDKIYAASAKENQEIDSQNKKKLEKRLEEERRDLHNKLANKELEVKSNFTTVEDLKRTRQKLYSGIFS